MASAPRVDGLDVSDAESFGNLGRSYEEIYIDAATHFAPC